MGTSGKGEGLPPGRGETEAGKDGWAGLNCGAGGRRVVWGRRKTAQGEQPIGRCECVSGRGSWLGVGEAKTSGSVSIGNQIRLWGGRFVTRGPPQRKLKIRRRPPTPPAPPHLPVGLPDQHGPPHSSLLPHPARNPTSTPRLPALGRRGSGSQESGQEWQGAPAPPYHFPQRSASEGCL